MQLSRCLTLTVLAGIASALLAWSPQEALARDGYYSGNRYLAKGLPSNCRSTTISGHISGSRVRLTLAYNGAHLSGSLSGSNSVRLTGRSGIYQYTFSGRLRGNKLSGSWHVQPRHCWGSWSVTKR